MLHCCPQAYTARGAAAYQTCCAQCSMPRPQPGHTCCTAARRHTQHARPQRTKRAVPSAACPGRSLVTQAALLPAGIHSTRGRSLPNMLCPVQHAQAAAWSHMLHCCPQTYTAREAAAYQTCCVGCSMPRPQPGRTCCTANPDATARQGSALHVLPSRTSLLTTNAIPCSPLLPSAGLQLAAGGRSYYTLSE